jgi:hypothetical protein
MLHRERDDFGDGDRSVYRPTVDAIVDARPT